MEYAYKVGGQDVALELDRTVIAVRFDDTVPKSGRARATAAVRGLSPFTARYEVPGERLTLVPVPPPAVGGVSPMAAIGALNGQPEVARALPVFRIGPNKAVPTERVILGLHAGRDPEAVARKHGLTLVGQAGGDALVATIPDQGDVFAVCRALDADADVDYAEPDFVTIGRRLTSFVPLQPGPLDPMQDQQYALKLTGALAAQRLAPARREVLIAILDEGVATTHPDLAQTVAGTFDGVDDDSFQEPNPWDGHGTACAGLAVAIGGNGIGIRGVAAGAGLLAGRIAYSDGEGQPWVTTTHHIARSIAWAWRRAGAWVISNSWGGLAPSSTVERELEGARTRGRGGLGCVIVIAAGNDGRQVLYPGSLPEMLTVGASNQFDEVKTWDSADGEDGWASCRGPEVSVVAPGVRNLTTAIGNGYDPVFNGTSSATPIVAGVAALILSARPELPEAAVRRIIRETAVKIGPFPYADGRNDAAGFGRVDALAAVQAAIAHP